MVDRAPAKLNGILDVHVPSQAAFKSLHNLAFPPLQEDICGNLVLLGVLLAVEQDTEGKKTHHLYPASRTPYAYRLPDPTENIWPFVL